MIAYSAPPICAEPNCKSVARGRGYCANHHMRALKSGALPRLRQKNGTNDGMCSKGCGRRTHARGMCNACYWGAMGRGEIPPLIPRRPKLTDMQKWAANVRLPADPAGCWEWTGYKNSGGYGDFRVARRHKIGHVYSYERFEGPVPDGLELDHLCRNRACVNPKHLEPVTQYENNIVRGMSNAGINLRKTHCKHGHEFTPENTYRRRGTNDRSCKACARVSAKERYYRLLRVSHHQRIER